MYVSCRIFISKHTCYYVHSRKANGQKGKPIMTTDKKSTKYTDEQKADALSTVIEFLIENEQYDDDWSHEIDVLHTMLDELV